MSTTDHTREQFIVCGNGHNHAYRSDPFATFSEARTYADRLEREALNRAYPMIESYGVLRAHA